MPLRRTRRLRSDRVQGEGLEITLPLPRTTPQGMRIVMKALRASQHQPDRFKHQAGSNYESSLFRVFSETNLKLRLSAL